MPGQPRTLGSFLFTCLGICLVTTGADAAQPATSGDGDNFVTIFNGRDLTGWHALPADSSGDWSVEDGTLVGVGGKQRQAYLVYDNAELRDFELKLSYRLPAGGNTGVEIRSRIDTSGKRPLEGYHADIGHPGIGRNILGAWDFHFATRQEYPCPRGTRLVIASDGSPSQEAIAGALTLADIHKAQWNELHIVARGNQFRFSVNGKVASEFVDHMEAEMLKEGAIGLQIHDKGTRVEFRDIRLKQE